MDRWNQQSRRPHLDQARLVQAVMRAGGAQQGWMPVGEKPTQWAWIVETLLSLLLVLQQLEGATQVQQHAGQ